MNENLPPVLGGRCARHQFVRHQPIDQPHCAVVAKLQSLRQFPNRGVIAPREALHRQQCLMLLRGDPRGVRRFLAKMEEPPERITERRECLILRL